MGNLFSDKFIEALKMVENGLYSRFNLNKEDRIEKALLGSLGEIAFEFFNHLERDSKNNLAEIFRKFSEEKSINGAPHRHRFKGEIIRYFKKTSTKRFFCFK